MPCSRPAKILAFKNCTSAFAAFIHTERDAMSSVADRLRDNGYDIQLNLRGAAAQQFAIRERTVVIRPKPTMQPHDGHLVTVEGLLVELFMGKPGAGLDG